MGIKPFKENLRIAVAQAAPVIMDKEKTIDKIISLTEEAASKGAEMIIFPETFIPAYPRGFSYGFIVGSRTMEGREDWKRYYDNSIIVPGEDTKRLSKAAKDNHIYLTLGVTEKDEIDATLYCTFVFFGPDGEYLGKHRKLKPTGSERLIWGEGDGSTLTAIDTPYGVVGSLICWENYMPLARMAMYAKGVSIYLAPTADARPVWQSTIKHIALEGRCFVISCNQYVEKSMYPTDLNYYKELENQPEIMCRGGSAIVNPFGEYVTEPVWDKEELIIADLDLNQVVLSRLDFDPCGHYNRPDVFEFKIK
ncbi:MAG: carbon-nitrogen hydrolase family protein [Lachnospiraceae bacterium]|nr:carbon-nitrogen hydrolase family protein [Lachnospiraceae bacterium]